MRLNLQWTIKNASYCAADDFEDLMAEPEKICVEMLTVIHHAWKTLDDAKKVATNRKKH